MAGKARKTGGRTRRGKSPVARELGAIHQWMKDHERHDDKRFKQGSEKMESLATKDDLTAVSQDLTNQMNEIKRAFLDEDGNPKLATKEEMEPLVALYRGGAFTKSFVLGAAALIGAIVGIGYGLITLIGWFRAPH